MTRDLYYGVSEQSKAAEHHWEDAQALFAAERWHGAMYLAGYSVECLLKARLMQRLRCRHLRELEEELQRRGELRVGVTLATHQLLILLRLTGGLERLRQNEPVWRKFGVVNRWLPAWRYTADLASHPVAEDFLADINAVRRWVVNNT